MGGETYQHVGKGLAPRGQKDLPQKGLLHVIGRHLDGQGSKAGLGVKLFERPGVVPLALGIQYVHVYVHGALDVGGKVHIDCKRPAHGHRPRVAHNINLGPTQPLHPAAVGLSRGGLSVGHAAGAEGTYGRTDGVGGLLSRGGLGRRVQHVVRGQGGEALGRGALLVGVVLVVGGRGGGSEGGQG